MYLVQIN